jgi:hypothetical protein
MMDREARIKKLARRYKSGSAAPEREAWDKAVQKVEREGSEDSRGPVKPAPDVGNENQSRGRDALDDPG